MRPPARHAEHDDDQAGVRVHRRGLNAQVFDPQGYRLQFQPEALPVYQEDERQRSASLVARAAGYLLMAMDILGYELSEEQRGELESLEAERQAAAEALAQRLQGGGGDGDRDAGGEELRTWRRWALKRAREGRPLREFRTAHVSPALAAAIAGALEGCATPSEVDAVFDNVWVGYP